MPQLPETSDWLSLAEALSSACAFFKGDPDTVKRALAIECYERRISCCGRDAHGRTIRPPVSLWDPDADPASVSIDWERNSLGHLLIMGRGYGVWDRMTHLKLWRADLEAWFRKAMRASGRPQLAVVNGAVLDKVPPAEIASETTPPTIASNRSSRPRASDACVRDWYIKVYMPECVQTGKEPSGEDDFNAAKGRFGERVRREQVRDVRLTHAPPKWRKQGRRTIQKNSAENSAK